MSNCNRFTSSLIKQMTWSVFLLALCTLFKPSFKVIQQFHFMVNLQMES
jgi:hypothetical protein